MYNNYTLSNQAAETKENAMLKELYEKYKSYILYVVFGAGTTLVNFASYYVFYNLLHVPNVPSVVISQLLAISFAFITNKIWVFESKSFDGKTLAHEIPTFFGARFATLLLDVLIMYLAVDVFHFNSTLWKLISNAIVIILNYIASKLFIFRSEKDESGKSEGGGADADADDCFDRDGK